MQSTHCPHCDSPTEYDAKGLLMSPFASIVCGQCGQRFRPKRDKRGRSDAQRRSREQEKQAAKRYNARRQAGSGTSSRAKGDIHDPGVLRGECKETTKKSFSLKLEELLKIEKEARGSELPLFEVQFQSVHPSRTYVVIPATEFQAMREEIEFLRQLVNEQSEELGE